LNVNYVQGARDRELSAQGASADVPKQKDLKSTMFREQEIDVNQPKIKMSELMSTE
jgi:hypothetical protein